MTIILGIYLHIPFCRQACRYCDFYFTVSLRYQDDFAKALERELILRSRGTEDQMIRTVYLGGGTPSLLSEGNMNRILTAVRDHYRVDPEAEISIECNPDDIHAESLARWKAAGISRLSVGIQSFREAELELMRRSHNAVQALHCLTLASEAGFSSLNADLIYGIPGQETEHWEKNLDTMLELPLTHLSAYHLTYEPGTVFHHWRKKGRIRENPEERSLEMYRLLTTKMGNAGFEHYEVSNFALPGHRSRHNMIYWSGLPYLGFGPSAHSFDGIFRSWNKASLKEYIRGAELGKIPGGREKPGPVERYHDHLITSLRTSSGILKGSVNQGWGKEIADHFRIRSRKLLEEGLLKESEDSLWIDPAQWIMADHIMRELFMDLD